MMSVAIPEKCDRSGASGPRGDDRGEQMARIVSLAREGCYLSGRYPCLPNALKNRIGQTKSDYCTDYRIRQPNARRRFHSPCAF